MRTRSQRGVAGDCELIVEHGGAAVNLGYSNGSWGGTDTKDKHFQLPTLHENMTRDRADSNASLPSSGSSTRHRSPCSCWIWPIQVLILSCWGCLFVRVIGTGGSVWVIRAMSSSRCPSAFYIRSTAHLSLSWASAKLEVGRQECSSSFPQNHTRSSSFRHGSP